MVDFAPDSNLRAETLTENPDTPEGRKELRRIIEADNAYSSKPLVGPIGYFSDLYPGFAAK